MKRYIAACAVMAIALSVAAQTALTVKSSPASDALNQAAKDLAVNQKSANDIFQQSRAGMSANQKALTEQLTTKQKALEVKMRADKKFGPMLAEIDGIVKQLQDSNQKAQSDFNQKTASMQQKMQSDSALMKGLIPVVRKENGFPEDAAFDQSKQTWSVPAKAPEKK